MFSIELPMSLPFSVDFLIMTTQACTTAGIATKSLSPDVMYVQ